MRKRKTIFCKKEFLTKFFESQPSTTFETMNEAQAWQAWLKWFYFIKRSDIIIDMSVEKFESLAKGNNFVGILHKDYTGGNCSISFVDNIDVEAITAANITTEQACAFYLIDKDDDYCKRLSNKLGLIVANCDMLKKMEYMFVDNGCSYPSPSDSANEWNIIGQTPSAKFTNTVLITDMYILQGKWQDKIENNIRPILNKLLPDNTLQEECQIAIFTGGKYEDYARNAKDQYDSLVTAIKQIRDDNFNFSLNIYYGCSKFHDRTILTNNLYITSGRGFDLFPEKKDDPKGTIICINYPFFNEGKNIQYSEYYLQVLDTTKHLASNKDSFRKGAEGIVYRLFEHYLSTDKTADERNRSIFPTTTAATATATTSTQQSAASNQHQQPTTSSPLRQRQRFTVVGNMDVSAWQKKGRWKAR